MDSRERVQACPECGVELPAPPGYLVWCHACGWNVTAPPTRAPRTRLDRLYAEAGRRAGDRLALELLHRDDLGPRPTPARVAACVIAASIHLLGVGLAAGGVALAVLAFPNPFAIVLGVVMLGAGFLMRPRLDAVPDGVLARSDAPTLHELIDEIAAALGTPTADGVVVDHRFNASWAVVGRRRRRVLAVGLPLVSVLHPQARVALLAHELAHGRNGDASRGLFVGSAVRSLGELYYLVAPERLGRREWELGLFEHLVNGVFWLLSRPIRWLLMLELHLLLRDSQRAEFLADLLAADVAGAEAVVTLHERALLESSFRALVREAAHGETEILERAAETLDAVPERELERRRRVARLETARLDVTHPPTAHRIDLVRRRGSPDARVVLETARAARIDTELAPWRRDVERLLADEYRGSLYYSG